MQYNTQQKKMPLPEYGRSIQRMVDYAITIKNRTERQRCANTIVNIMGGMFPHLRDLPDFKHKLWDHLAVMSNYELDIDYPFEIVRKDTAAKPDYIPYLKAKIRFRHYGRSLETLISRACEMPEGEEKQTLVAMACNHMRKDYLCWNKDTVDDRKIAEDLYELSEGRLHLTDEVLKLMDERMHHAVPIRTQKQNFNFKNNKGKNKKKKKNKQY